MDSWSSGTFWQGDYSAHELFGTGTFQHLDILAWGPFDTDISALKHFGTMDILAKWMFQQNNTFLHRCQKVCSKTSLLLCMVPKFSSAEMSMSG